MAVFGKRLFRLRTLLLSFTLLVLLIPLGSFYLFRLFEDELVLRTELELISQSAVLAAIYKQQVALLDPAQGKDYGLQLPPCDDTLYYQPVEPLLSLATGAPLPRRPDALPAPITDDLSRRIGEILQPILGDAQRVTLSGMRILDWRGVVIAGREETGLSLAAVEEVAQALQGHYAANIRQRIPELPLPPLSSISRGTQIRLFTAYPVVQDDRLQGVIYLSRTPENILKFLYREKERVLWPALLVILATLSLAIFLSARIVRPIEALIRQTEQMRAGADEPIQPIAAPGTRELAQLSRSFARMANSLRERSRYIEQFAGHVSHEFKTPLTAMQGALELLLDHDDMPEAQRRRFLGNLLADTERLKALVGRLLELARADNLQAVHETTALGTLLDALRQHWSDRGLELHFPPLDTTLTVNIAPDALRTVLDNLLGNSLQHGAGQVEIGIAHHDEQHLTLTLHDNGPGISPANRAHLFTPFFTTRRPQGGTGLGLGIVRSLLNAYQGTIELGETEHGALFLLTLKCN